MSGMLTWWPHPRAQHRFPKRVSTIWFERLGIVDAEGKLVTNELPPDMLPDSDTTLETG